MIEIYKFYKMCVLLSLFIEPSYFSTPSVWFSEWVAYLYSSQLHSLLWMCSLYHMLSFLPLSGTQGSFKK